MKKVYIAAAITIAIIAFSQVLVWFMNKDLHKNQVAQYKEAMKKDYHYLKKERVSLEMEQEKNLQRYQWLNKGTGHVQIPIERAFDYYLRASDK